MDDAKYILAGNLMRLMALSADMKSQAALAKRSKVAQTTIGNYLHPARYRGSPTLENIAKLAKVFGLEPWQLIHPALGDRAISAEELALYRRLRDSIVRAEK